MANFFKNKKFTITISGSIVVILVNVLRITEKAAKEITVAIMALLASFNIGRGGEADGLSKGKTSSMS